LLLVALLAGCGPIVQLGVPSSPPPVQHVLSDPPPPATAQRDGPVDPALSVTLLAASAPAMLQTTRIPVRTSGTEVRYIVGDAWTEPPARLFMQLLAERLTADAVPVIDRRVAGRSASRLLGGELSEFGVDARGAPKVRIRFDATLTGPDGIRRRSFAQEAPISRIDGPRAASALSAASDDLATEISRWVAESTRP
jgi:cholesterol transport system auxiliary component